MNQENKWANYRLVLNPLMLCHSDNLESNKKKQLHDKNQRPLL